MWLDILTAVRLLGGDTSAQIAVVVALDVLAAALTFVVVWRWLHPALALPAALLLTRAVATNQSASALVNGSASTLFDVMTAAGVLCYALSNRLRFLLVAAFAAALAVNVHIAAVTLVPARCSWSRRWGARRPTRSRRRAPSSARCASPPRAQRWT